MSVSWDKARYALSERERRARYTPEQREAERERGRRRYAEGKLNPEWYEKRLARHRASAERQRRARGVPVKNRLTPEERRTRWKRRGPRYLLVCNLRRRVLTALKGHRRCTSTFLLLGCSREYLRARLEAKFRPGMTWENYGPVWHVDHIRPCASFDLTDPAQQRECFHFSNLQPLFAAENLAKGDKIL